ncbi:MAG TPA: (2Fe-2S)-binding protein [Pseudomonadales bacterium]|nr:(2Fe-2S)-binding protein [Pseudomonadales bacterium]
MFVCICNAVTDGKIRAAVDAGAASVRDLNREFSLGNCCGKCIPTTRQIIKDRQAERAGSLAVELGRG